MTSDKVSNLLEENNAVESLSYADSWEIKQKYSSFSSKPINIMITGATGSGKSSTINAIFGTEIAKIGTGSVSETESITKYEIGNLILWDTPGLGDGVKQDEENSKNIQEKLNEVDENGAYVIDMVLVVLDASTRELKTAYELINNIVIPNLGENNTNRIQVGLNMADMAMKGRHWNAEKNRPERELINYLNEAVKNISNRIKDSTGLEVNPVYYAAGYKEEGKEQSAPYNIPYLIYNIIHAIPEDKRYNFTKTVITSGDKTDSKDSSYRKRIIDELNALLSE